MKKLAMVVAASMATALAAPAFAQSIPEGVFYLKQQPDQILARDILLGAKVKGPDGKIVGDVEDLILTADNRIVGVIMGVGGFLGLGEKRVGVRYYALDIKSEGSTVVVNLPEATPEVLKALPPYERLAPPKSLIDRAIEKAKELADKTSETSKDAYAKAKEQAGPAYEKAKEAAGQAYEKAKEVTNQAVEKAKEMAKPTQPAQ